MLGKGSENIGLTDNSPPRKHLFWMVFGSPIITKLESIELAQAIIGLKRRTVEKNAGIGHFPVSSRKGIVVRGHHLL
jgi:hypothetical protein